MGLLDDLNNLSDDVTQTAKQIQNTAIPPQVQNLADTDKVIDEKLTELEKQAAAGQIPTVNSPIIHLRILLMNHYGHLQQGGEPDPFPEGKMHPLYQQVKDRYTGLDERLSRLEKEQLQCTFGYQTASNEVKKPTLDWSQEEWLKIKNESKDQIARCWLDADKNNYC